MRPPSTNLPVIASRGNSIALPNCAVVMVKAPAQASPRCPHRRAQPLRGRPARGHLLRSTPAASRCVLGWRRYAAAMFGTFGLALALAIVTAIILGSRQAAVPHRVGLAAQPLRVWTGRPTT